MRFLHAVHPEDRLAHATYNEMTQSVKTITFTKQHRQIPGSKARFLVLSEPLQQELLSIRWF